jgi:energy-coupling factor transporter ATP-binding protein EcfA2
VSAVIETTGLGKRYRQRWALTDCTLSVPAGQVVGLVGPNGAGKTTLLSLAVGMLAPTTGAIEVLGGRPAAGPAQLARVGFLAQGSPVYAGLSVADHLKLGAHLNPGWDAALAQGRVDRLDLDRVQRNRQRRRESGQRLPGLHADVRLPVLNPGLPGQPRHPGRRRLPARQPLLGLRVDRDRDLPRPRPGPVTFSASGSSAAGGPDGTPPCRPAQTASEAGGGPAAFRPRTTLPTLPPRPYPTARARPVGYLSAPTPIPGPGRLYLLSPHSPYRHVCDAGPELTVFRLASGGY